MRQPVRTYKLRRSRITVGQSAAIRDFGARWLLDANSPIPPTAWAQRYEQAVLEIGFGMGESTLAYARLQPTVGVVAFDLHTPGIGNLLSALEREQLDNVRVMEADALNVLRDQVAPASLQGLRIFFPDPWPKARHHKRRLVNAENLVLMASRVQPGGFLHFATDWPNYAEVVEELLQQSSEWELLPSGSSCGAANPAERPRTKFEQRGIDAGRPIADLVARRR